MQKKLTASVALTTLVLTLASCGGSASDSKTPVPQYGARNAEVVAAQLGVNNAVAVLKGMPQVARPAALFSIYANILLADGMAVPVASAMQGIEAQMQLHSLPTQQNVDDLYALLQEFGAVLHVDVVDLLNRSDDRSGTLDAYVTGLTNITERSARRSEDLKQQIAALRKEEQEKRRDVTAADKDVKAAITAKDFAAAQQKQSVLLEAQTELTKTSLQLKELSAMLETFNDLLDVAHERIAALNSNREVLIAGLKVVNLPGVENLGVLENRVKNSRTR